MNLELTDEQVALRDTVRRFLAEKAPISGHVRPLLDDPTGTHRGGVARAGRPRRDRAAGAAGIRRRRHDNGRGRHRRRGARRRAAPRTVVVQRGRRDARTDPARRDDATAAKILTGIADGTTIATVGPLDGGRRDAADRRRRVVLRGEIAGVPDAAAADVLLVFAEDATAPRFSRSTAAAPGISADARARNRPDPQAVSRRARRRDRAPAGPLSRRTPSRPSSTTC